jgi:hypothetical protein
LREGVEEMSILIKGMEMPEKFDPDVYIELACGIDGKRYARLYNFHIGGLTEWCETISVPPHGRCIDADALHEELYALEYARENEWLDGVREARGVDAARVALLDAPTIIGAEEEGE